MRGRSTSMSLTLFPEEIAGDRGIIIDEEAAFAVEEFSAGGKDGNFADAVGFCERTEAFGVENLEPPEAGKEDRENERDEILGRVKLADGQLLGLVGGTDVWASDWGWCSVSMSGFSLRLILLVSPYHSCW